MAALAEATTTPRRLNWRVADRFGKGQRNQLFRQEGRDSSRGRGRWRRRRRWRWFTRTSFRYISCGRMQRPMLCMNASTNCWLNASALDCAVVARWRHRYGQIRNVGVHAGGLATRKRTRAHTHARKHKRAAAASSAGDDGRRLPACAIASSNSKTQSPNANRVLCTKKTRGNEREERDMYESTHANRVHAHFAK